MAFPTSPTNGQTTTVNNILYRYNSSVNRWERVLNNVSLLTNNTASIRFGSDNSVVIESDKQITNPIGGAIAFDRTSNGYLSMSSPINFGTSSWTVEAWVYPQDTGQNFILGVGTTPGVNLYFSNTIFVVQSGYGAAEYFTISYTPNTWTHFAVSFDGTYVNVWVNGVGSGKQNYGGGSANWGNNILSIGAMPWASGYGNLMRMTQLRIVVGSLVYDPNSSHITVPSSQLTNIANTQFLMLANSSGSAYTDTTGNQTITNNAASWVSASPFSSITNNLNDWVFGSTGTLKFPDNTIQLTAYTGTVAYNNIIGVPASVSSISTGSGITVSTSTGAVTISFNTSTLVQSAVNAQFATTTTNFNTSTLVQSAVNAQFATTTTNFNTGTLVKNAVNAQFATTTTNFNTGTLVASAVTATSLGNGVITIANTSASTSTNTGALVVAGGVGINGNVNIGGAVLIGTNTNLYVNAQGLSPLGGGYFNVSPVQSKYPFNNIFGGVNTANTSVIQALSLGGTLIGTTITQYSYLMQNGGSWNPPANGIMNGGNGTYLFGLDQQPTWGNNASSVVGTPFGIYLNRIFLNAGPTSTGTVTNVYHIGINNINADAASSATITNVYGIYQANFAQSNNVSITNAYGFYGRQTTTGATATNWNLYMQGNAPNYMAGNLYIGTTVQSGGAILTVNGGVNVSGILTATTIAATSGITINGYAISTSSGGGFATTSSLVSGVSTVSLTTTGALTTVTGITVSSATGALFVGDFDNLTVNNRTNFVTKTVNSSTGIYAIPNGTSGAASWQAANSSNLTNASKILIATNGSTDVQLVSGINGSGTYLPLSFYTNGASQMQLSTAGVLTMQNAAGGITVTGSGGFIAGASGQRGSLYGSSSYAPASNTDFALVVGGGSGGNSAQFSSSIQVQGGANNYSSANGYGGQVQIYGGNALGTNSFGGNVVIQAGSGTLLNGAVSIGVSNTSLITLGNSSTFTTGWAQPGFISSTAASLGYLGMPQNSTGSAYTLLISDQGKHIYVTATSTVTIPSYTTVNYPIGTTIAFIAAAGATVTIAITSDTLYLGGSGTTGSRTLAPYGMATAVKVAQSTWFINGTGLT